jgi:hypothetical protein
LRRGDSLAQWSYSEPIRGVLLASSVRLGKTLGAINPKVLNCVATAASETLGCYDKPVIEPPGMFSLLGQFRHKELRRSMALINRFLERLGNQIKLRGGC